MPQSNNIEGKNNKQPNRIKKPRILGWWLISLLVIGVAALLTGIALKYRGQDPFPPWVSFLSGSILNLLLLTVVVIQSYIYRRQWEIMHEQVQIMGIAVEPRLRVTNVRVEDFEVGKHPVFIVSIINEGAIDARDVVLDIQASLAEQDAIIVKWNHPQIVTIPAHQEQFYFVQWKRKLHQDNIDAYNDSVPIKVSGFFKLGDTEQGEFCYRYYPWKGKRPEGVCQFIPCDFDPSLNTVVKLEPAQFKLTGGNATMTVRRVAQQEQKSENPTEPPKAEADAIPK